MFNNSRLALSLNGLILIVQGICFIIFANQITITMFPFSENNDFSSHKIGDATTYQSALVAALDDEVISEDEWAMLNELRNIFGIQPDQHALIEEAIRSMSEEDENGERRLERLARYNILCPYS